MYLIRASTPPGQDGTVAYATGYLPIASPKQLDSFFQKLTQVLQDTGLAAPRLKRKASAKAWKDGQPILATTLPKSQRKARPVTRRLLANESDPENPGYEVVLSRMDPDWNETYMAYFSGRKTGKRVKAARASWTIYRETALEPEPALVLDVDYHSGGDFQSTRMRRFLESLRLPGTWAISWVSRLTMKGDFSEADAKRIVSMLLKVRRNDRAREKRREAGRKPQIKSVNLAEGTVFVTVNRRRILVTADEAKTVESKPKGNDWEYYSRKRAEFLKMSPEERKLRKRDAEARWGQGVYARLPKSTLLESDEVR